MFRTWCGPPKGTVKSKKKRRQKRVWTRILINVFLQLLFSASKTCSISFPFPRPKRDVWRCERIFTPFFFLLGKDDEQQKVLVIQKVKQTSPALTLFSVHIVVLMKWSLSKELGPRPCWSLYMPPADIYDDESDSIEKVPEAFALRERKRRAANQ